MLARTTALAGGMVVGGAIAHSPRSLLNAFPGQTAQVDPLAQRRAALAATPISTVKLADGLVMLSGPGGNVAVLSGPDGLVVVDTFVQPAWPALRKALERFGGSVKTVINTHWHFDHADNNASFRQHNAVVIAHANTAKRMSERHDILGMRIEPSPETARPTQTFGASHVMQANGESLELAHLPGAHTDTDIYIRFPRADVLHLGDTYFNGGYPFIDVITGGTIGGMIQATNRAIKLAGRETRIIPGHGAVADVGGLTRYRDMLVTVRDRVQKLKASGRTVEDVLAEKPTADLDEGAGKAFLTPDMFVRIVYDTI
jgi:glyoxylase-like metal-dependent hydrolase (beta-lactamase superfamily II)